MQAVKVLAEGGLVENEARKKVVLPLFQHLHQEMARLFQLRKEFWEMLQVTFSFCLTDSAGVKRPPPHVKGKGRPPKALSGEPKIVRGLKTDACHPGETILHLIWFIRVWFILLKLKTILKTQAFFQTSHA